MMMAGFEECKPRLHAVHGHEATRAFEKFGGTRRVPRVGFIAFGGLYWGPELWKLPHQRVNFTLLLPPGFRQVLNPKT